MYIYQRTAHHVDALIENHFWLKVVVNDAGAATGVYSITLFDQVFAVEDTDAGVDDSDALAAALIVLLNDSALDITALAGANPNEILIRFNAFGQIPVDIYNQKFNFSAQTSDADGTISIQEIKPTSYDVQNASNWDGVFASMQVVPYSTGTNSARFKPTFMRASSNINANQLKNRTRFLFDPSDYSLDDNDVIFLKVNESVDGETYEGPIQILMAPRQYQDLRAPLVLSGTAPAGATQDDALTLQFPRQVVSISVKNLTATPLYVSFGVGSAEFMLEENEVFKDNRLNTGYISVRGNTACEIYAALATNTSL